MGLCGYNRTNTEALEVITDGSYVADGARRPAVWAHGHGSGASTVYLDTWVSANGERAVVQALTGLGLPIFAPQLANDAWGNDLAQTRAGDTLSYAGSPWGAKNDKAVLCGLSMGGLAVLNYARANPTKVACICLFYPVVNLVAVHDATGGATDFSTAINAAYTDLAGYNAAKATHDPAQNAASYTGVPIKMWYSTGDAVVGTANQTAFATAVGGSAFESQSLGAVAHAAMGSVDSAQVVNFVSQHL